MDSTNIIRMVLSKFAVPVQEAWNRNACKIREKEKREAYFEDVVFFMDSQSRLLNNPSYSREAFGNNIKLQDSYRSLLTHISPGTQEKGIREPCLCCGDSTHLFEDCTVYLKKSLVERRKFIFNKDFIIFRCELAFL